MKPLVRLFPLALLPLLALLLARPALAEILTVAAASDLKFAMAEVVEQFRTDRPKDRIDVIYGSSGKFFTQIANGAPFDMYFSADIAYPRQLEKQGLTSGTVRPYAFGRIVLWSLDPELAATPMKELPWAPLRRFAIANPRHAPYGMRAQEALEDQGVWAALQPRLVLGENIAHTAQFIDSGAAEAGIVALALVLSPTLKDKGAWTLIPAGWHAPLEQGFVITARAADNALAAAFADYMTSEAARVIMRRYGFVLPGEEK
ncbi:MAG: molybdate ABC transporter substrate-binding protein [Gammaproteobacteria bacterium]|nr:molybdate ABC transporter substrate-binding protein [Gammaproteobacteria bacterium]